MLLFNSKGLQTLKDKGRSDLAVSCARGAASFHRRWQGVMADLSSEAIDETASEAGPRRKGSTARSKRSGRSISRESSIAPTETDTASQAGSDDDATPKTRRVTRGKQMPKVVEETDEEEEEEEETVDEDEDEDEDVEGILDESF